MASTLTAPRVLVEARPRAQVTRPAPPRVRAKDSIPDIVDVWGDDSFPASDPPANW